METENDKQVLIRLDPARDQRLKAITAAMTQELGIPVSRTATIRRMIDLFSLPEWSVNRTTNANQDKSAA